MHGYQMPSQPRAVPVSLSARRARPGCNTCNHRKLRNYLRRWARKSDGRTSSSGDTARAAPVEQIRALHGTQLRGDGLPPPRGSARRIIEQKITYDN